MEGPSAEDKKHALVAVKAFELDVGAKWPKAVAKITDEVDALLAFYDYPAEHWIHLRTTDPIESTFATVRLCDFGSGSPKAPAPPPPAWPWPSNSSSPRKPASLP